MTMAMKMAMTGQDNSDNSTGGMDIEMLQRTTSTKRPRVLKVKHGIAGHTPRPRKQELDALRAQVVALTDTLTVLRAGCAGTLSVAAEDALTQRRKRRHAQQENQRLKEALHTQSRFVQQLRGLCAATPVYTTDGSWCDLVHNYTRLPSDAALRHHEFQMLSAEPRLRHVIRRLVADTHAMPIAQPSIQIQFTPRCDGLAATTVSVYALDTTDISQGLRAACVAIREIAGVWPQYRRVNLERRLVETTTTSSKCLVQYGIDTISYTNAREELVVVQTRVVTLYTVLDDCGLVMWDFVDDDALHPWDERADVARCAVGACLLRVERCDDGVDRVVCRSVCAKKYLQLWRGSVATSTTGSTSTGGNNVDRFFSCAQRSATPNGSVFKDIVVQQVAEEAMLLGIAQSACC